MARTWVKLFCTDWITGSIRKDEPIVRDVLTGLMALAGLGVKSNEGKVELIGGIPYEMKQLAETLNVKQPDLESAIKVLSSEGRINVDDKGIITILNWKKYQSEYERTKPYRVVEKVQPRVEKEIEKEKEVDKEIKKKTFGEFKNVSLTAEEYDKLKSRFGETGTLKRIENLSAGVASKGYKYKSHYAAILAWDRKDGERNQTIGPKYEEMT